jgi:hypothetical protein
MGKRRGACRVLVVRPDVKIPLGRPTHRWEKNIKMKLQEVRWASVNWVHLSQGRDRWRAVVNVVMNFRIPQNAGNFLTS